MKTHSQLLLWLLVAATLAVDAVAVAWFVETGPTSRAAYLFEALVTGQLAVVCLWAVIAARRMWASLLTIGVAVVTSTALEVWAASINARESFGGYAVLAAALVAALWILKQTPLWRKLSTQRSTGWQFSVGQVLVVMTLVALLLASLRETELVSDPDQWMFVGAVAICNVVLTLACVLSAAWLPAWWLRLALDCAVAIVLGVGLTFAASASWLGQLMSQYFTQEVIPNTAYMVVIALVLFAWLELAPILPELRRAEPSPPAGLHTP